MDLKKTLNRNVSDVLEDLLQNFDSEFMVGRYGEGEGMEPRKAPLVTDDEEVSSFNSLYDQVRFLFFVIILVNIKKKKIQITVS